MAARKTTHQTAETRLKIQAGNIINRLQKCVDGEVDLTAAQVKAASIVLNKTLPDLKAIEVEIGARDSLQWLK